MKTRSRYPINRPSALVMLLLLLLLYRLDDAENAFSFEIQL